MRYKRGGKGSRGLRKGARASAEPGVSGKTVMDGIVGPEQGGG